MSSAALLLSLAAAGVTFASFAARWHWLLELTTHWPTQLATGSLLLALILLAMKQWRFAMLPGMVMLVNALLIAPLYWPLPHHPIGSQQLRAIAANVYTSNTNTDALLDLVQAEAPDILVAMEVNRRWQSALAAIEPDYPHRIIRPRQDNFGIALFSRHQITSQRVEHLADSEVPTIFATVNFHNQPIHVIATHPLPPIGRAYALSRNRHLEALAKQIARLDGPVLLLGDLNTTSWSPVFADFVHAADLHDSRRGFGPQATWPAKAWHLRIPLDHALVSPDLVVTDRRVGSPIGSDHLPVIVDVTVQQN